MLSTSPCKRLHFCLYFSILYRICVGTLSDIRLVRGYRCSHFFSKCSYSNEIIDLLSLFITFTVTWYSAHNKYTPEPGILESEFRTTVLQMSMETNARRIYLTSITAICSTWCDSVPTSPVFLFFVHVLHNRPASFRAVLPPTVSFAYILNSYQSSLPLAISSFIN